MGFILQRQEGKRARKIMHLRGEEGCVCGTHHTKRGGIEFQRLVRNGKGDKL